MAQLTTQYKADDIALNYIYPTLENVSVLIPGVTINPSVSVAVGGASAYYYKNTKPSVTSGASGRALTTNISGNERKDILMSTSFQIDDLIPSVVASALSIDVLGDKMVKSAAAIANSWSKEGLIKMVDNATAEAGTASTKSTIYGNIINTMADFDIANPERAIGANYVIVTPTQMAFLRQSDEFLATSATAGLLTDGIVGSLGGLQVLMSKQLGTIVASDLTNYTVITGLEYIVGAADAFCAPTNFREFRLKDSELYFGVKVQAELSYGFDVADANRIFFRAAVATAV